MSLDGSVDRSPVTDGSYTMGLPGKKKIGCKQVNGRSTKVTDGSKQINGKSTRACQRLLVRINGEGTTFQHLAELYNRSLHR